MRTRMFGLAVWDRQHVTRALMDRESWLCFFDVNSAMDDFCFFLRATNPPPWRRRPSICWVVVVHGIPGVIGGLGTAGSTARKPTSEGGER